MCEFSHDHNKIIQLKLDENKAEKKNQDGAEDLFDVSEDEHSLDNNDDTNEPLPSKGKLKNKK